jgi:hypothetical protein
VFGCASPRRIGARPLWRLRSGFRELRIGPKPGCAPWTFCAGARAPLATEKRIRGLRAKGMSVLKMAAF